MRSQPVGVFDSGVGGISVLKHIRKALPAEDLLYCADSRFAPYGSKSPEVIRERSFLLADFLLGQGAKALVVACNTATAAAVAALRESYAVPIVGMEPAVKPAVKVTRSGVIGVLATSGTLKSAQFAALLENYGQNVTVVTQACHGLVECIERGELDTRSTEDIVRSYVWPLLQAQADAIVLGCTHYPFVRPLIARVIRELLGGQDREVSLIDTGEAVARQLARRLAESGLENPSGGKGKVAFWSNSASSGAEGVIARLWAEPEGEWAFRGDWQS